MDCATERERDSVVTDIFSCFFLLILNMILLNFPVVDRILFFSILCCMETEDKTTVSEWKVNRPL